MGSWGDASGLSGATDSFGLPAALNAGGELGAGDRVGPVTIVRLVGAGGMGLVYEATQDSPARRVAVKVLRPGAASPEIARRFTQEADLLARLQHPHIAQVHLAGQTATAAGDRLFLVLELIEGAASVTDHADRLQLTIRQRVALVADAAAAVAHAHRMGVVHRDLKPGNILVNSAGSLRVIDFGVARLLAPDSTDRTVATQAGALLGTVRYMSPEQLGLDDEPIDTRTDVYALGLVLHELLLGELPYELRGRTLLEATALLGQRTVSDPRPLIRRLRGRVAAGDLKPLAVILATCLEPQARNRYADAGELHADLDRWLAGEAIRARPPTLAESLSRLARRHRAAALAAITVLATLLAAVAGISWFSLIAARQRHEADAARLVAEQALEAADQGRRVADARAREARQQLYLSTVLLAAEARDRDNITEARRLLAEARQLATGQAGETPELDCLAASLDESLAVWPGDDGTVQAVAFSPSGDRVAVGTAAGTIAVWQPASVRRDDESATPANVTQLAAHDGPVWGVTFSPDGRLLATASADQTVRIHAVETTTVIATLGDHAAAVYGVAFSPSGQLLASASRDGSVRLWNTTDWTEEARLEGHSATVFSVRFSPAGDRILTASRDGTARIWKLATRQAELTVNHGGRVFAAVFSGDGQRFATAGEDATARIWDASDGRELVVLRHPQRVNAAAFLSDQSQLATASGDGLVRIWDVDSGAEVSSRRGHAAGIWSLAVHPLQLLAATGSADSTSRLWNLAPTGGPVMQLGDRGLAVTCGPDGDYLAAGLADGTVAMLASTAIAGPRLLTAASAGRVNDVSIAADGQTLLAACDDGTVRRWSLPEGLPSEPLPLHRRRVYAVAASPDGRSLATASEDRSVRLVDLRSGADRLPPLKHPGRVFSAAFLPLGHRLATACEDRLVRIWDAATGQELIALAGHEAAVNWVCLSPDGARIASASSDGSVRVWPVDGEGAPTVLTGPARQIWKAAWSPGGTRIAACSADGTVQLWDVASGRPVATLRGHRDQVWGVTFSAHGHGLFSASWDGTLRAWGRSASARARLPDTAGPE